MHPNFPKSAQVTPEMKILLFIPQKKNKNMKNEKQQDDGKFPCHLFPNVLGV